MRNCLTNKQKRYTMNKDDSDVDINKDINVDMGFTVGQVSLNRDIELSWKLLQKLTFDVIISYVRTIRLTSLLLISMGIKVGHVLVFIVVLNLEVATK